MDSMRISLEDRAYQETVGYSIFVALFNVGWAVTRVSHVATVNCITTNSMNRVALTSCHNAFTMVANLSLHAIAFSVFEVNPGFFLTKARGGTCTLAESNPPETVLHGATYFLQNGFGYHNVIKNKCEDFSVYCRTGFLVIDRVNVGNQAASILAVVATMFSSPLRFLTTSMPVITTVAGGVYCLSRLLADIGNRKYTVKIPVKSVLWLELIQMIQSKLKYGFIG